MTIPRLPPLFLVAVIFFVDILLRMPHNHHTMRQNSMTTRRQERCGAKAYRNVAFRSISGASLKQGQFPTLLTPVAHNLDWAVPGF